MHTLSTQICESCPGKRKFARRPEARWYLAKILRGSRERMQTVTNSLSQTLHHFLLLCVHTLFYTHTKVSSPHTAAPDPIFLARRLRRRFTVSQHTNTEIAGISVFSVSKCAMSAGALVGHGEFRLQGVLFAKIAYPTSAENNGPACENMHRRPPASSSSSSLPNP